MLKIYVIVVAFMYVLVAMVYAVEFGMTHSGWGTDRVIEYALLWPARLI